MMGKWWTERQNSVGDRTGTDVDVRYADISNMQTKGCKEIRIWHIILIFTLNTFRRLCSKSITIT